MLFRIRVHTQCECIQDQPQHRNLLFDNHVQGEIGKIESAHDEAWPALNIWGDIDRRAFFFLFFCNRFLFTSLENQLKKQEKIARLMRVSKLTFRKRQKSTHTIVIWLHFVSLRTKMTRKISTWGPWKLETGKKQNKYTTNDYGFGYHNWFQILAEAKSWKVYEILENFETKIMLITHLILSTSFQIYAY